MECPAAFIKDREVYYEAAKILRQANQKKATLKTLIYASKYKNIRQLFALVSECVKYQGIIQEVLSYCSDAIMQDEVIGGKSEVATVLLYEYLFGRKFGKAASLRRIIQNYKHELKSAVDKVLKKHKCNTLQEMSLNTVNRTGFQIPRYVRVNLIKSSVDDVIQELQTEGWNFVGKLDDDKFSESVKSLDTYDFGLDPLLFDVLVFPSRTDLHDHALIKSGVLVQQDRASCVPAHVLNPSRGSVVLDCCAAPGNKTSHLASLMKDVGRVIALDRDLKRMSTMTHLLEKSGAKCVELIHQDFLTVQSSSEDAEDINFILVDPSCSGSGMLGSHFQESDMNYDIQRLETLKRFQISILKHALRFPNVERVVYSTCSVYKEENEQVVEEVMTQVSENFQFHSVLPELKKSRGLEDYPHASFFLRLSPQHNLTQGFFVACFERLKHKQHISETKIKTKDPKHKESGQREDDSFNDEILVSDWSGKTKDKQKRKRKQSGCVSDTKIKIKDPKHKESGQREDDSFNDEILVSGGGGKTKDKQKSKRKHSEFESDTKICEDTCEVRPKSQKSKKHKCKHKSEKTTLNDKSPCAGNNNISEDADYEVNIKTNNYQTSESTEISQSAHDFHNCEPMVPKANRPKKKHISAEVLQDNLQSQSSSSFSPKVKKRKSKKDLQNDSSITQFEISPTGEVKKNTKAQQWR